MGGERGRVFRNTYKRHMDKTKGGLDQGREGGWMGLGEMVEGKWRQLYLNNNKKYLKKKVVKNNI